MEVMSAQLSEHQIAYVLRQLEEGVGFNDLRRAVGISAGELKKLRREFSGLTPQEIHHRNLRRAPRRTVSSIGAPALALKQAINAL